jgi:endonuclease-3
MNFKNETLEEQQRRMQKVIELLANEYPDVKIQLNFSTPFELLVATILSAQCTDERVNKVTPILFAKYKNIERYFQVPQKELEEDIFSTGFYKSKAEKIQKTAKIISEKFNGEVPNSLEKLLELPGVGRKTANVILGHIFNIPAIVVDTHVVRITNKLGFVDTENAEKIEFKLMDLVPKEKWVVFTHYLINHGRKVCIARKPKCQECVISKYCPTAVI